MTVPGHARPVTQLELVTERAGQVLGARVARRIAVFPDGTLYVRAGEGARLLAWLVDFLVFLLAVGTGVVAVALADRRTPLPDDSVALALLGLLVLVPSLYALCFRGGRALGGVLTGTRLVRAGDGRRLGVRAWWAMLVRTVLLPLLVLFLVTAAAGAPGGQPARTSIDARATDRLRAAGFGRLTAPPPGR